MDKSTYIGGFFSDALIPGGGHFWEALISGFLRQFIMLLLQSIATCGRFYDFIEGTISSGKLFLLKTLFLYVRCQRKRYSLGERAVYYGFLLFMEINLNSFGGRLEVHGVK